MNVCPLLTECQPLNDQSGRYVCQPVAQGAGGGGTSSSAGGGGGHGGGAGVGGGGGTDSGCGCGASPGMIVLGALVGLLRRRRPR